MYVFTPEQHCLLELSAEVWRRRGLAKRHGLGFNEETASEMFLLDLAERFPGEVTIVPFTRREEARIGADWAWAFVGPDGQWCQGMLVRRNAWMIGIGSIQSSTTGHRRRVRSHRSRSWIG